MRLLTICEKKSPGCRRKVPIEHATPQMEKPSITSHEVIMRPEERIMMTAHTVPCVTRKQMMATARSAHSISVGSTSMTRAPLAARHTNGTPAAKRASSE
jgi:hypothetical protein